MINRQTVKSESTTGKGLAGIYADTDEEEEREKGDGRVAEVEETDSRGKEE